MRCPVCGYLDTEVIRISPQTYPYSYCSDCESIFLRDLSLSIEKDQYSPSYLDNHAPRKQYGSLFNYYEEAFLFDIGYNESTKPKFLEIGFCNLGVLMEANEKWECSANDVVCMDKQKQELKDENITFYEGDILITDINDKFDLIWITHVIEHFSYYELQVLLVKIKALLKDNGIAFISSINSALYGTDESRGIFGACRAKEGHKVLYSAKTFYSIARKLGFQRHWFETYTDPIKGSFQYATKFEWRICMGKNKGHIE